MIHIQKLTNNSYPLDVLQRKLLHYEVKVKQHEDLAAVCAKWLVYGVNIEYYGFRFQQRQAEVAYYAERRNQIRQAIEILNE
jgi:hypothetical protein